MWHVLERGEMRTRLWWGNLRVRENFEDLGTDGKIILKWIFKKPNVGTEWINLTQNRDRRRNVVNGVMNTGFDKTGDFLRTY